jgi:hypothetical protein
VSHRAVIATLEAARPGPSAFLYAAGAEAGLSRAQLLTRAGALYLAFSATNLCDDLNDGECTYLLDAARTGPCIQFILHHAVFAALTKAKIPLAALAAASDDLVAAGGAQRVEMDTNRWTAVRYKTVGEGIAGRQWAAYLRLLWHGTWLEQQAAHIGMLAGIATHVAEDIYSGDRRYTSLSARDKRKIVAWARAAVKELYEVRLDSLNSALENIAPILAKNS